MKTEQELTDLEMMKNPEKYNPALTPCLNSRCDRWDNEGE